MYRIEMAGELFYNVLADRVGNETAADLLRKNAVEERGHARRLARMVSIKLGHEWEPTAEEAELLAVPLPDGPTKAWISPSPTSNLMASGFGTVC